MVEIGGLYLDRNQLMTFITQNTGGGRRAYLTGQVNTQYT